MAPPTLANVWENPLQGIGASGLQVSILVILIIIFVLALLYMVAVALRNERMRRWLVGELMQTFASAIMILGLIALASFIASVFTQLTVPAVTAPSGWGITISPAPASNPLEYVHDRFDIIDQQLDKLYADVVKMDLRVERAEWTCFIFFGTEVQCGWSLHPLTESLHALAYKLVQYRVGLNTALLLVNYIDTWFIPLFLPIGIVLRAIPFTRGAGGLLIALVLGFYFVFPIIFLLTDVLLSQQLARSDTSFADLDPNKCVYADLGGTMQTYAGDLAVAAQAKLTVQTISATLATLILEIILTPLIALAATVLFIRAFSPIFGAESQEVMQGLSKIL
ncbi:Uncharacterised protein [Candidatus Burarchaeum australiense]|nr:Uncharacterised protein [Candidatus Burarchaeum australiense]